MGQIEIYIDGPSEAEMVELADKNISGYTFNPTLFKNLGVVDYIAYSKVVLSLAKNLPVSLEVIGDSYDKMIVQGRKLSSLGSNVIVKIPISYTSGASTLEAIKTLSDEQINLNITAVFTLNQIKRILPYISETNTIISVFAGRLYDIGIDASESIKEMSNFVRNNSNCRLLWASPRMHYDCLTAERIGCHIITMTSNMYKKMSLLAKSPEDYSKETVRMFYRDAVNSGFEI